MNTLKIKLDPYRDINIASLDDKPLSPYSELNNYMKEPFLSWASKLLDMAEREINDDFSLVVTADQFEKSFLEGLQNDFDSCVEYKTDSFQVDYSVDRRLEFVKNLAAKYRVPFSSDEFKMPVFSDVQVSIDSAYVSSVSIDKARLIITNNEGSISQAGMNQDSFIAVLISDKNKVTAIDDEKYVWEIPADGLDGALNSIIDRFVKIPAIVKVSGLLKNVVDKMGTDDRTKLSLATAIDSFVTVADVPSIEVGQTVKLNVSTYPAKNEPPVLRVVPHNTSIVSVNGLSITAVAPGTTVIDIYKDEENVPFERKNITTFQNNFVKQISISVPYAKMAINRKQSVDISFFPEDADDAGQVEWSVDNPYVLSVTEDGEVISRNAGTAVVTAKTKMASASASVEVLPNIQSIALSVTQSNLFVGQVQPISVAFSPNNCFDPSYEWRTDRADVAVVDRLQDGRTVIRATGIGSCTLTCIAKEGGCYSTCTVNVDTTFNRKENKHGILSLTAVLAIIGVICAVAGAHVVAVGVAVLTFICGVWACVRNKSDIAWAVILIIVAIIAAL